jgi:hypothetical protein
MKPIDQFSRREFLATTGALVASSGMSPSILAKPPGKIGKADDEFLDTLQRRTFDWFWETTNPENGLVPDRWPTKSFCSVAAVGFGLAGYGVGVERGYVSRQQAIERTLNTLRFFAIAPQSDDSSKATGHHGFFYHFLNMQSGLRHPVCELSSIDTSWLMCGVLFAREYFDRDDAAEREIRELADALYRRVEWTWMQPRPPLVCMSWRPEEGFGSLEYKGYDEAMLLYVLALGSPTHPIDPAAWNTFTSTYKWGDFYGYEHVNFAPLFGHQFAHVFVDFRGIRDAYMREKNLDYFENSRRATYAQQAYAIKNPMRWKDYGEQIWGLTACDGPADVKRTYAGEERLFRTYSARGAGLDYINDDGTIAPTAAGGSIPFAPEICIPALRVMRDRYGDALFTKYGFLDSFNPSFMYNDVELKHGRIVEGLTWVDGDYLGIDQGPILLMAENFRTEHVWNVLKKSPYIRRGLERAGFTGGWLDK